MVVEDDRIDAEFAGVLDLGDRTRAAVRRDDERDALSVKFVDGGDVHAVAFGEAVREVGLHAPTESP